MSDPTFDLQFQPQYGMPDIIARRVRRIVAPNAGVMTFRGTNTYLVGEGAVTVIDPGPKDDSHAAAILKATEGETIERILLTHSHADHSGGVAALVGSGAVPVHLAPGKAVSADAGTESPVRGLEALDIADGELFSSDGFQLEAIATPGHASDHMCFALAGTDILFSGDHVMGWSTTVVSPPDGSMGDYMRSLDRLLARPERRYLPGHGGPIANGIDQVRGLRTHRRMREAAIIERLRQGDRTIGEIVAVLYRGVDPRLTGAAGRSVLAHLEDLVERGIVAAEGPLDATGTFKPAL